MAAKKSYNRFFIILQEEDKGYGLGPDRPPTGYVKVETKGDKSKVTVYVQNLKPFENGEYLYRCYLISHQEDKDNMAYLGLVNIDDSGRGESSWESAAEDAFNTKTPVDKYNGAAIIADREGSNTVLAPLAGYMSKEKFEWRSKFVKNKHAEEKTTELSPEAIKFEEYEKQVAEAAAINARENIEAPEKPKGEVSVPNEAVRNGEAPEETEKHEIEASTPDGPARNEDAPKTEETVQNEAPAADDEPRAEEAEPLPELEPEAVEDEEIRGKHKHHKEHKKDECSDDHHDEEHECHDDEHNDDHHLHHEEHKCDKGHDHDDHHEYHEECKMHDMKYKNYQNYAGYNMYGNMYGQSYSPCSYCTGCSSYNTRYYMRHAMRKALEDILSDYDEIREIKELKGCRLWKVDMEKCRRDGYMVGRYPGYDLVFYPMLYNPSVNYLGFIGKHGNYLFGIKYGKNKEAKRLIYCIPGKKRPFDQPFEGRTGFVKWVPEGSGDNGYWVMMYDPMTGIVDMEE